VLSLYPQLFALANKPGCAVEISVQYLRNLNISIGILKIFENRNERPPHGKA
jgi:hypothetical protein